MMTIGKRNFMPVFLSRESVLIQTGRSVRTSCGGGFALRPISLKMLVYQQQDEEGTMADSSVWWILTGAAVAVELITSTFYLLMLAVGLAAAAVAAHLGASLTTQIVVAAVVGGVAVVTLHLLRRNRPSTAANANRDVHLDIGETVQVDTWNEDGTANVKYRGANWTVVAATSGPQQTGTHRVREMSGNRLVVEPVQTT
jgi:membrane protein implicated in regulation of membrane protease activity